jgi:CspA family cold shock protein
VETLKFKLVQFAQNPVAAVVALLVAILTPIQETIVDVGMWLFESTQSLVSLVFPSIKNQKTEQYSVVEPSNENQLCSNADDNMLHDEERNKQSKFEGTVKWFSNEKGYGFINYGEKDVYFNVRNVQGAIVPRTGDPVCFNIAKTAKGEKAVDVVKTEPKRGSVFQINKHVDHRTMCPHCGRKITPRLITYRGEPSKSLCPFCGGTVSDFSNNDFGKSLVISAAITLILILMLATCVSTGSKH